MLASIEPLADAKLIRSGKSSEDTATVGVASVLGFSGDAMRGSLVVVSDRELLAASHPNLGMGMPVEEGDIADWSGEIANQMLGRIKNRLFTIGVKFSMSTPTTVTSKAMQIRDAKDGYVVEFAFSTSKGAMVVHFLTIIAENVSFDSEPSTSASASEGDSFMF
jgi:CheY-specific phosphatase CheX